MFGANNRDPKKARVGRVEADNLTVLERLYQNLEPLYRTLESLVNILTVWMTNVISYWTISVHILPTVDGVGDIGSGTLAVRDVYAARTRIISDGDSVNPSYTWNSDPNTGIYHTSNALHFTTDGTNRLSVTGSTLTSTIPFNAPSITATTVVTADTLVGISSVTSPVVTSGFVLGDITAATVAFRAAAGSAMAPSYAFTFDTTTGIYNTASALHFTTAGTLRLSLTDSALTSTVPYSGTTITGTVITGTTSVSAPTITGTTSVTAPTVTGTTLVTAPTVTGTTITGTASVTAPTVTGTTLVTGPAITGTTSVTAPTVTGTTLVTAPTITGTTITGTTSVTAPTVTGTTLVTGPAITGTTSVTAPTVTGTTSVSAPLVSATTGFRAPVGSAGTLSYSFTDNPGTGIFNSPDTLHLAVNGARVSLTETLCDCAIEFSAPTITGTSVDGETISATTAFRAPIGAANAPGYSFTGDTTTGIYNTASALHFTTAGVLRLSLTGSALTSTVPYSGTTITGTTSVSAPTITGTTSVSAPTVSATSTGFRAVSGAAGAPSYSFTGGTTTGMYYTASGVHFSTNSGLRLSVTGSALTSTVPYSGTTIDGTAISGTGVTASSAFYAPLGSVGAPSYSFTGDSTTGIYNSSSTLRFTTAGVLRLSVNSSALTCTVPYSGTTITGTGITASSSFNAPDGTTSLPSYTFTGDTDTGLYHNATNECSLSAGGTTVLTAKSTGVFIEGAPVEVITLAPIYGVRAWVKWDSTKNVSGTTDATNTARYLRANGNVASVTKNATAEYTIEFDTAANNTHYCCVGSCTTTASAGITENTTMSFTSQATGSVVAWTSDATSNTAQNCVYNFALFIW